MIHNDTHQIAKKIANGLNGGDDDFQFSDWIEQIFSVKIIEDVPWSPERTANFNTLEELTQGLQNSPNYDHEELNWMYYELMHIEFFWKEGKLSDFLITHPLPNLNDRLLRCHAEIILTNGDIIYTFYCGASGIHYWRLRNPSSE